MDQNRTLPFLIGALVLALTACGSSSDDERPDNTSSSSQSEASASESSESSSSESSESSSSVADSSSSSESSSSESSTEPTNYSLYKDGLSELTFTVDGEESTASLQPGAYSPGEPVESDATATGAEGETVWGIQFNETSDSNVFLQVANTPFDNGLSFNEALQQEGALEFDLWVEAIDEETELVVKIDSGWPNLNVYTLDIPEPGEWVSVSLPIADFIPNTRGDGSVNFDDISNPFVLEALGGTAIVQLNNIRYHCESDDCEIEAVEPPPPEESDTLEVYVTDLSAPFTNLGVYAGEIDIEPITETDFGTPAFQFSYSQDATVSTAYINSEQGSSKNLEAFAGGNVVMELKVIDAAENTSGFLFKADYDGGASAEVSVPLPDNNDWNTITIPVDDLTGLDLSSVTAPWSLFPVQEEQAGVVFQVGDIRWEAATEE